MSVRVRVKLEIDTQAPEECAGLPAFLGGRALPAEPTPRPGSSRCFPPPLLAGRRPQSRPRPLSSPARCSPFPPVALPDHLPLPRSLSAGPRRAVHRVHLRPPGVAIDASPSLGPCQPEVRGTDITPPGSRGRARGQVPPRSPRDPGGGGGGARESGRWGPERRRRWAGGEAREGDRPEPPAGTNALCAAGGPTPPRGRLHSLPRERTSRPILFLGATLDDRAPPITAAQRASFLSHRRAWAGLLLGGVRGIARGAERRSKDGETTTRVNSAEERPPRWWSLPTLPDGEFRPPRLPSLPLPMKMEGGRTPSSIGHHCS